MERKASFREARWRAFERGLGAWLESPEGRFAAFSAQRERALAERRALLRRVALAATVLPAPCVGCALRLALVAPEPEAARILDEVLASASSPAAGA